jgi:hypothetical protein
MTLTDQKQFDCDEVFLVNCTGKRHAPESPKE